MLTEEQINKNYEEYLKLIDTKITRDGKNKLVEWLKTSDLKTAPASAKYHSAYKGGLVKHSLNVYNRLKKLIDMEYPRFVPDDNGEMKELDNYKCPYTEETIALVALLHDMSKINYYDVAERNVKTPTGEWTKVPFYQVREMTDRLVYSTHAANSLFMIDTFISTTYQEKLAILYHMGGFDSIGSSSVTKNVSEAYVKSPLALLLHQADMMATYIDESGTNE